MPALSFSLLIFSFQIPIQSVVSMSAAWQLQRRTWFTPYRTSDFIAENVGSTFLVRGVQMRGIIFLIYSNSKNGNETSCRGLLVVSFGRSVIIAKLTGLLVAHSACVYKT